MELAHGHPPPRGVNHRKLPALEHVSDGSKENAGLLKAGAPKGVDRRAEDRPERPSRSYRRALADATGLKANLTGGIAQPLRKPGCLWQMLDCTGGTQSRKPGCLQPPAG